MVIGLVLIKKIKKHELKNARAIMSFQGFEKEEDIREYIKKWFKCVDDIVTLEKRS